MSSSSSAQSDIRDRYTPTSIPTSFAHHSHIHRPMSRPTSFDHSHIHRPMRRPTSFDHPSRRSHFPPSTTYYSSNQNFRNRPPRQTPTPEPFQKEFFRDEEKTSQNEDVGKRPFRRYEVFLSFRGEDTRASFTSHLYASLQNAGITVFMDEDSLKRGDVISASLLQAIEESQIAVIVFSKNYANSRWCLNELVKIMECHRTIGQVVLPVFYGVDPSDVRHRRGEFGIAFESLLSRLSNGMLTKAIKNILSVLSIRKDELPNQIQRWKEALGQAAGFAGFPVLNSRNESEAIKYIVENVTVLLDKTDLFVANNPVGIESRLPDIVQLFDTQQSNDVLLLGLWGMGGMGKMVLNCGCGRRCGCGHCSCCDEHCGCCGVK